MNKYDYLIIGGGMTGSSAVKGIREQDGSGSIGLISQEPFAPYDRPPLTKSLWDHGDIETIMRNLDEYQIEMILDTAVVKIDPIQKTVTTRDNQMYQYEKLLLATGGDPIKFPDSSDQVIYYRTREDFQHLLDLTLQKETFCVIGGGFIGSELAAALNKIGKSITMIFPESGITGNFLPNDLASYLIDYYQEKGINVLQNAKVDSIFKSDDSFTITYHYLDDEQNYALNFDVVVAGIGIKPNDTLAKQAGLTVENGIVVNEFLQTNNPDIFAAGDVANFFNFNLGKRTRVEHEDNANTMGKIAGVNMTGRQQKYDHFPIFYSDLFDLGYEAVGEINKSFTIFEDWIDLYKKGTIYYLQGDRVKGIIFWNLWGKVDEGKRLIQDGIPVSTTDLKGKFNE